MNRRSWPAARQIHACFLRPARRLITRPGLDPSTVPLQWPLFRNRDCLLLCAWTGYWFEQVVWLLVGGVREGRVAASGEDPSGVSTLHTTVQTSWLRSIAVAALFPTHLRSRRTSHCRLMYPPRRHHPRPYLALRHSPLPLPWQSTPRTDCRCRRQPL